VLQCVAVCCSVLQCVAVCCSVLQCVAVCCAVAPPPAAPMSCAQWTFSKVNSRLNSIQTVTVELTFENFYPPAALPMNHAQRETEGWRERGRERARERARERERETERQREREAGRERKRERQREREREGGGERATAERERLCL